MPFSDFREERGPELLTFLAQMSFLKSDGRRHSTLEVENATIWSFSSAADSNLSWKVRVAFWSLGTLLAIAQAWAYRYFVTSDAIAYMDMSDGVLSGGNWHRVINGVWSPLYPFLIGVARRVAAPTPIHEIRFDHLINIIIFLFAFFCFEFLLQSLWTEGERGRQEKAAEHAVPEWVFLCFGYGVFLWASLHEITLQSLRPDMLMSGFLYVAVAILLRMRGHVASWGLYSTLGLVLGVGYLSKAPMLPIGLLVLAISLLVVDNWRVALAPALLAVAVLLVIGSLYYGPLSRIEGRFTFGDSSTFNYLVHVDGAGPGWYITDMGFGVGKPEHSPRKIFDQPPAYEFAVPVPNTHPLRFDPSYWTQRVTARFKLRPQVNAFLQNIRVINQILLTSGSLLAGLLTLCLVATNRNGLVESLISQWPLTLIGLAGIGMYSLVHVEDRYVGAFFALFWLGISYGLYRCVVHPKNWASAVLVAIPLATLIPMVVEAGCHAFDSPGRNIDAEVAIALRQFGVNDGDSVARISTGGDLGWARVSRVRIIAEVDWELGANSFWPAAPAIQDELLAAFAKTGVKAVVAHNWGDLAPPAWQRLGKTHYWVHVFSKR